MYTLLYSGVNKYAILLTLGEQIHHFTSGRSVNIHHFSFSGVAAGT